jgi:hypothetical protein
MRSMNEQQPQRQGSLDAQLRDVIALANKTGCYDAADAIQRHFFPRRSQIPPQWCPICKTYHHNVGERTDAGKVTRPCPLLADFDAQNWMGP